MNPTLRPQNDEDDVVLESNYIASHMNGVPFPLEYRELASSYKSAPMGYWSQDNGLTSAIRVHIHRV